MLDGESSGGQHTGQQLKEGFDSFAGNEGNYAMVLHLSQLCVYVTFFAGIIVPIVLWMLKKDESTVIDQHGRNVVNWMISSFIYGVVFFLATFILIGIPLLIALAIAAIVFPIIGALKAQNGEIWAYPCTIRIL